MGEPQRGIDAVGRLIDPRPGQGDHLQTVSAAACAAECCARSRAANGSLCGGYTWDPRQPASSGGASCPPGQPCCWLKAPGAKAAPASARRLVTGLAAWQHLQPFDDEPSTTFVHREPAAADFSVSLSEDKTELRINTTSLRLVYRGGAFTAESLRVEVGGSPAVWTPGAEEGNLNGSLTSTDCSWCESLTECSRHANSPSGCIAQYRRRMQPGLLSRTGWHLVDDTGAFLFDGDTSWPPHGWRKKRDFSGNYTDWTLFGYGVGQYRTALADFAKLAGPIPLMPWRAYGVWWSNYFPFNVTGISDVIRGYEQHSLPLHYVVLDVDWHREGAETEGCNLQRRGTLNTPLCTSGYGGYSWNRELFPDPIEFQAWLHARNLSLMLNLHDLCGTPSLDGRKLLLFYLLVLLFSLYTFYSCARLIVAGEDHCQRAYKTVATAAGKHGPCPFVCATSIGPWN
eukprot:SAG31_NODE_490_length_14932_cov_9.350300_12_plen_456_part_00